LHNLGNVFEKAKEASSSLTEPFDDPQGQREGTYTKNETKNNL
jgi:hypothetical protein